MSFRRPLKHCGVWPVSEQLVRLFTPRMCHPRSFFCPWTHHQVVIFSVVCFSESAAESFIHNIFSCMHERWFVCDSFIYRDLHILTLHPYIKSMDELIQYGFDISIFHGNPPLYQWKYFHLDQSNGKIGTDYIKKKQVYLIMFKYDIARSV